jgi:FkbM family methyltransferase
MFGRPSVDVPTILPPSEELETDVGRLLIASSDQVMRRLIAATGDWEHDEAILFAAGLRRGMTVVDVGAHVGYYTLLAAKKVGRFGRVLAVEPDPTNNALLRANVVRNHAACVHVLSAAAWSERTPLSLHPDSLNTGDGRVSRLAGGVRVEGVPLDDVIPRRRHVHRIKIDAQGTDHVALRGMERIIHDSKPVVFVEFAPEWIRSFGDDPAAVIEYYRSIGFRLTMPGVQLPFNELRPSQFVDVVDALPGGFTTLVLRPPR